MNSAENKFLLTDIGIKNDNVIFEISLISDSDEIRSVYLNNYFEGIYFETGSKKYNLYTQKIGEKLISEMRYEAVTENAVNSLSGNLRLYAALRIGENEVQQPVEIIKKEVCVSFGHWSTYYFTPFNDFKFCFLKQPLRSLVRNSAAILSSVIREGETVEFRMTVPEKLLNGAPALIGTDAAGQHGFELMPQKNDGTQLVYKTTVRELLYPATSFAGEALYEFKLSCSDGTEYDIYIDSSRTFERLHLPMNDRYAVLLMREGKLCIRIKEYFGLELCGVDNDFISLRYPQRPYPLEVVEIIAQRVNTNIEYSLPLEKSEADGYVTVRFRMVFGVSEQEFKNGVYQFWIVLRDGAVTSRGMLKIIRTEELTANTYLIQRQPFAVIGEHYYNCIFYCDTSNLLKCGINPKYIKAGMKCGVSDGKLHFKLSMHKEPFFDENIWLSAVSDSGKEIPAESYGIIESKTNIAIDTSFDIQEIFAGMAGENISPLLTFGERDEIKMPIRNNINGVPVPKRVLESFSEIIDLNGRHILVWADFKDGAFVFGVSSDLRLFTCESLDADDKELIITAAVKHEYKSLFNGSAADAELENVIDKRRVKCKANVESAALRIYVDPAKIELGDYNIWLTLNNGIKSSLVYGNGAQTYRFNGADKKCELRVNNGELSISVQELLLFENSAKCERSMEIAEKMLERSKGKNRKVWLVGENYGLSARDNGLAFFEYCMQRKALDAEVYFVSKKTNKDISALDKYKNNVIIYDSDKHLELDAISEFYIVSHGIRDVMPSLYHNKVSTYRKPVIYLQHGIMAMKVVGIDNNSYGGSIRRFIVSSQYEKHLLTKCKQFWDSELAVTGLARYDKLTVNKEAEQNYIWIMPTWRDWLVSSHENFVNTKFYQSYKKLLTDDKILKTLRDNNCRIVFSLHIEFEKYKPLFDEFSNDVVEITDMHSVDISQIIRECKMIVTDYSSIIFDVVYLNKPVLFFQFDRELYDVYRGSYVDMENDLPGEVLHTAEEMADALVSTTEQDFEMSAEFAQRRKKYFDFEDHGNSERIYNTILEVREEISDEY